MSEVTVWGGGRGWEVEQGLPEDIFKSVEKKKY